MIENCTCKSYSGPLSAKILGVVTVLTATEFSRQHRPLDVFFSKSELSRRSIRAFNLAEHIRNLKQVYELPVSLKDGKFLFLKIFLDGTCSSFARC